MTTSETPSASGLERAVAAHVQAKTDTKMSEEASATLALAMATTAVSIRLGEAADEMQALRKVMTTGGPK